MRKSFSSLSKAVMTLAMLLASVVMAKAADPIPITEVNQVLTAGVTYSYGQYADVFACFNVPATGKLRIDGFQGFGIYEKCTTPGNPAGYSEQRNDFVAVDPGASIRELQVTEGTTIYFVTTFAMDAGTVTLYMEGVNKTPLEIQYYQPTPGEKVDFNNYSSLQATFNQVVKLTDNNADISFLNRLTNTETVLSSRVTGAGTKIITVPFYSLLKPYIASGAIKPGDEFKVTIKTLVSEEDEPYVNADANGNCVFTFLCGSIPVICTQQYCPDPFVSYWPAGTTEGILKMTFNDDLGVSDKTYASLSWGNQEGEEGQFYYEELPVKIEGNTATVDFTGKLRTPATMTPNYPDSEYSMITIGVIGLVDKYGVPVGSGSGTIGSYTFAPRYKVLDRATIATEFEPNSGSDLAEASKVNVWISGINSITFDGFKIEATDKNTDAVTTYIVEMKDVTVTPDGSDAAEYDFNMPQEVLANAKTAVVTLNNVVSLDGYDHTNDVRAVYGGFVITYSDPANGTELASLNEGDIISIETNLAEKYPNMYIEYQVIDTNPGEGEDDIIKSSSWLARQEDGSYQSTVYGDYKLMYGKEYHVEFTAWEDEMTKNYTPGQTLGSDFIIIRGLTIPYNYSAIQFTDITPAAESLLAEDCTQLTVTFDGVVSLGRTSGFDPETGIVMGMGMGIQAFKEVTPAEEPVEVDGTTYASKWNLVLPDNYLASQKTPMLVSFKAYDEEGRLVKGNEGKDEETYFLYSFDTPGMYQEITVTIPENATRISEISVSYPTGIDLSWEYLYSDVKVLNRMGEEVTYMADFTFEEDPENPFATITEGKIVLNDPITEEGFYMLHIPRGFFNLGTEFDTAKNVEVNMPFSIMAAEYTAFPEQGVVNSLDIIEISYLGGDIKINDLNDAKASWASDNEVDGHIFTNVVVDGSLLKLTFDSEITEPGTYQVTVPAGFIQFSDGTEAPAVNLTYTIEAQGERPNITVNPEEGNVTSIPQGISIIFNDYDAAGGGMGKATLKINDGEPINLPDAEFGAEWNEMVQGTGTDSEYTADGTYVFSFPRGYFLLGDNGDESPAFTLTYTIGGGQDSVEGVEMNAEAYTVYTLAGVRVLDRADREAFKALAPGLYIVNGVKMILK